MSGYKGWIHERSLACMLLSDMSSGVEVKAEKLFSREQKAFLTFLSSASGSQSKANFENAIK